MFMHNPMYLLSYKYKMKMLLFQKSHMTITVILCHGYRQLTIINMFGVHI